MRATGVKHSPTQSPCLQVPLGPDTAPWPPTSTLVGAWRCRLVEDLGNGTNRGMQGPDGSHPDRWSKPEDFLCAWSLAG